MAARSYNRQTLTPAWHWCGRLLHARGFMRGWRRHTS